MGDLVDYAASGSVPVGDVAGLIARLESAEAGAAFDMDDADTFVLALGEPVESWDLADDALNGSLDAALTLVESIFPGSPVDLTIRGSAQAVIQSTDPCGDPLGEAFGSAPHIALCIAALKAIQHGNEDRQVGVNK